MASFKSHIIASCVVIPSATTMVLVAVSILQDRPIGHLALLCAFLLVAGGTTTVVAMMVLRRRLPLGLHSLRGQLVMLCTAATLLGLAISAIITAMMLFSIQNMVLVAAMLGYSLAISVLIAFAISDFTANAIGDVLRALRLITAGNLDVRVDSHSPDEVGEVGVAVNALAERLETSLRREHELSQARQELMRAVSHDLKTPLASIRAMVESINDGVVTDPNTVRRYMRATESELEQLTRLVDDLSDLGPVESGVIELNLAPTSVKDLISDTVEGMSALAKSYGLVLSERVDVDFPTVMMDPQRVRRVLNNLVHNAIGHTPPGGSVVLTAHDVGWGVEVSVMDSGEGIPEDEISRLLDVPSDAMDITGATFGGTSLGLNIVSSIVQAHGGRFWMESEVGEGSKFSFTLPKSNS